MDYHEVWKISWTRSEYGGNHWPAGDTYHETQDEAYAFKDRRENRSVWPPVEDFFYTGSITRERVTDKEYESIHFTR